MDDFTKEINKIHKRRLLKDVFDLLFWIILITIFGCITIFLGGLI